MARTAGGTGRFVAAFLPAAAGGPFGSRIFDRMGNRENLFHVSFSTVLALQRIAACSHSLPDL
jgi:outer membrane lipoprotein SlyB